MRHSVRANAALHASPLLAVPWQTRRYHSSRSEIAPMRRLATVSRSALASMTA